MGRWSEHLIFCTKHGLVLRSIGERGRRERKQKGPVHARAKTDNMLQQPHRHSWLYHPHCHAQKMGTNIATAQGCFKGLSNLIVRSDLLFNSSERFDAEFQPWPVDKGCHFTEAQTGHVARG